MKLTRSAALILLAALALTASPPTPVATLSAQSEDEVLVVAAWAPDGQRLAYGTERRVEQKRSPLSVEEGPVVVAWRHDGGDGQLRRRLRPG